MKRQLLFMLLIFNSFILNGQENFINTGIGYVIFGEGDFTGLNYYSNLQFKVSNSLNIKIGVNVANASETSDEYYYNRHNVFNFANNYNVAITPIKIGSFSLALSAGAVWRYRTEIYFNNSRTVYTNTGVTLRMIENDYNTSFDIGYNADVTALFKVTERVHTGICGNFMGYNKGSSLYSISLSLSYRL